MPVPQRQGRLDLQGLAKGLAERLGRARLLDLWRGLEVGPACRRLSARLAAAGRGLLRGRSGRGDAPWPMKGAVDPAPEAPPSRQPRRFRRPGVKNLVIAGLGSALAVLLLLGYHAFNLPLPEDFAEDSRGLSLLLKTAEGETFASRGRFEGDRLTIDELPDDLIKAVVAIEDRRFYDHGGVDLRGLLRAALINLRAGEIRQGGSTITQQLAKLIFLSPERTLERKIQELMLALWMERRLDKDRILALYLNRVYFGAGAYGADAAARRYFGKAAKALSLAEAAMLAGLVKAPSQLAPTRDLETARRRAGLVLEAMLDAGFIDGARYREARDAPAELAVLPEAPAGAGYFANWVEAEARGLLGGLSGDVVVRTTLNPGLQRLAESVVARRLEAEGEARNVGQAALVAMTPDGAVLAMVGGRDYATSQFNRATQARRQPGSAFKLFVFLAALEGGMSPRQRIEDAPITVEGWSPRNYDGRFHGPVTLEEAFARSLNTAAVRVSESTGRREVVETARRLGLSSRLEATPSLALGTSEVSLLELTGAYATLPNQGFAVRPQGILEIRESSGRALYRRQQGGGTPVVARRDATAIDGMLRATVEWGTGKAAQFDWPAAGKTGTSQDSRDAWFIGYTANLVVGVWTGNDDATPMQGVTGGALPAQIWRDFASRAYAEGLLPPPATRKRIAATEEPRSWSEPAPRKTKRRKTGVERFFKRLEKSINSLFD
ncbi:MAG: PBP1A family penicillin-binding protein [Kiloniellales bacterium]|nr:PBP1A family penicillin-binding protein [Kiloniellales bacterium]